MDISYSNKITDIIKTLRQNVYNSNSFQSSFKFNLENIESINIHDIVIASDYYGGLSIDLKLDGCFNSECLNIITTALIQAISSNYLGIDKFTFMEDVNNIGTNLINIISTGSNSLVIKI